jgi:hypothetical protein
MRPIYNIKILIFFPLLLSFAGIVAAQEVQFTASASPNVMRSGETFNLVYSSNEEISELSLPEISNFELLGGPSQGHSQSVYSVNGKITTSSTYQYTYFLRAVKAGKYTIPPANARIKSKSYQSNPVDVEVVAGTGQPAGQSGQNTEQEYTPSASFNDKDLFVSLQLDKSEAYLGQQITATVKIYSKLRLSRIVQNFKGPDFTGFFTEPYEVPPLRSLQREVVQGDIYNSGVLKKVAIIPQKTGVITIQPFEVDVAVRQEVRRKTGDPFFDDFFFPEVQDVGITLKSKPVKINVRPLPPGAPASFEGAVGSFKLSSSLSKNATKTNEPITLKLMLSGTGNIKLINKFDLNVPYDIEKFDPVINTRMDNPAYGTKTFEYMLIPHVSGSYTLPPVVFSYFDPGSSQYRKIETQAFNVSVEKGQGDTLVSVLPGVSKEDIQFLNRDIRFINNNPFRLTRIHAYLFSSPYYYLAIAGLLVVFLLVIIAHGRMMKRHKDIAGFRLKMAGKFARKRLKKSAELLKQGKNSAFYEELLGATWGYLSDKLKIPVSSLSKDAARLALHERSVDEMLIDELFRIIGECEMARYAQIQGNIKMDRLYRDTLDVISRLQQTIKE